MATVTFNLKDPKAKNEETLLYMVFCYGKRHISISTGLMVKPNQWSTKGRRLKNLSNNVQVDNINTRLEYIRYSVLACYNNHLNEHGTLYTDKLKDAFRELLRPTGKKHSDRLTFVKGAKEYHKTCNKKLWTKKHYWTTIGVLEKYETHIRKKLEFEDIDLKFYNHFVNWCESQGWALNTIGSHIKEIKVFMNYAIDMKWTENVAYLHKKFKVMEETADTIYLTTEELEKMYRIHLEDTSKQKIRDLFIIGAYTGLRYQDLAQLTPAKFIKDNTMLKVTTEKTGETVIIPLHPFIIEILEKYDGHAPEAFSDQEMNRSLKIIASDAGLKEKVSKRITKRGMKVYTTHDQFDLVTVHTARRSFATNAFLAGIPTLSIMKITGHRTERSFLKYIKVSAEQNAELIKGHKFFQLKLVNN